MVIEKLADRLNVSPYEIAALITVVVKELTGGIEDSPDTRRVIATCLTLIKAASSDTGVVTKLYLTLPWLQQLSNEDSLAIGVMPKTVSRWASILQSAGIGQLTRVGPNFYDAKGALVNVDGPAGDALLEGHSFITQVLTNMELVALSNVSGGHA